MKRFLTVFLTFALFLPGCAGKETEESPPPIETGIASENAADFAVIGGELWVIEDGEAHKAGETAEKETDADAELLDAPSDPSPEPSLEPSSDTEPGFDAAFIASDGGADGKTPILCSRDGVIFWDGETVRLNIPEAGAEITSFAAAGDTAVAAYAVTEEDGKPGTRLVFYNRTSGDSIAGDPLVPGRAKVLPCDGEHVWIMNQPMDFTCYFYRTDVRSMQSDLPVRWEDYVVCAGWDAASETLYAIASRGGKISEDGTTLIDEKFVLHVWDFGEGEGVLLPFEPEDGKQPADMSVSEGKIILKYEDGTLSVRDAPPLTPAADDGKMVTLAVVPAADPRAQSFSESIGEALITRMAEKGLTVRLKRLSAEKINVKLLAGDDDFDLFVMEGSRFFGGKGYWEPLEQYGAIAEQADKMLPDALRLCSFDGHLFGVPYQFNPGFSLRVLSEKAAERIGLTAEELGEIGLTDGTWTVDDYYALALRAKENGCSVSRGMLPSLSDWGSRYMDPVSGKVTDPDGAVLRHYLEIFKKMRDGGLFWEGLADNFEKMINGEEFDDLLLNAYFQPATDTEGSAVIAGKTLVFSPTFDGERSYSVGMSYFLMNPKSRHKENAAKVLACILDPENEFVSYNTVDFYFYRQDEERMATEEAKRNWRIVLDAMRYYTIQPAFYDEWTVYAFAEEEKYLNDEQDLDYTVKRILERAKMVLEG